MISGGEERHYENQPTFRSTVNLPYRRTSALPTRRPYHQESYSNFYGQNRVSQSEEAD